MMKIHLGTIGVTEEEANALAYPHVSNGEVGRKLRDRAARSALKASLPSLLADHIRGRVAAHEEAKREAAEAQRLEEIQRLRKELAQLENEGPPTAPQDKPLTLVEAKG